MIRVDHIQWESKSG